MKPLTTDWKVHRILVTGDLHLRPDRLQNQTRVMLDITSKVLRLEVDLLVVNGDIAGSACPHVSSPKERNSLLNFITSCRQGAPGLACPPRCRVIVVRGNHDVADDWRWLSHIPGVYWCDRPTSFEFDSGLLHVLPYPDKSWLAAGTSSQAETSEGMRQGLEAIMHGFAAATPPGMPSLLVGHVGTSGAEVRIGQPLVGQDVDIPTSMLQRAGADAVLLNHIHMPQNHNGIIHVGSPWPTRFGENEDKSVCLWHVREKRLERLPTPHPKLRTAELIWDPQVHGWYDARDTFDKWPMVDDRTRLRLRLVYPEGTDIDVDAAKALFPNAATYRIERAPIPKRRERAPEVVQAKGAVEQFIAYEKSEGREVSDELVERVYLLAGRVGYAPTTADGTMRELRLKRAELVDFGVPGHRILDMDQLPDGIIGIDGANGSYKTTTLEATGCGAAFRFLPSRSPGRLHEVAVSRTAVVDAVYEDGDHEWRLLHHLDGDKRKGEAHIYRDGVPYADGDLISNGKVRVFDRLVAGVWPTWEALAATRFQVQGGGGSWAQLTTAERRELLREMLGLAGLQSVADEARASLQATHADQGDLAYETEKCEEKLKEWDRNRIRLDELRQALDESTKAIEPLEAEYEQTQADLRAAMAWERAARAREVRAEIERLRVQRDGYAEALRDAEARGTKLAAAQRRAQTGLDSVRARDRQAAAAWSQYRERERAIEEARARLEDAQSKLTTDELPDLSIYNNTLELAELEAHDAQEKHRHDMSLRQQLEGVAAKLEHCRRGADLAGRVPCGGEGDYAACELLQDALEGKAQIVDVQAACDSLRDRMTGVTSQDVANTRTVLETARDAVFCAESEARAWFLVGRYQHELAEYHIALGVPPELEADLADALTKAEAEHRSASDAVQIARDDYTTARASLRRTGDRLAELGDPPDVEDVPEWRGPTASDLARQIREIGERLQQLRQSHALAEGEARALKPLVKAGTGLSADLAGKQVVAANLAAKAADLKRIQDAFGPRGIQAVLVHDAGPAVSEATNALICEAYGWQRFSVDLQTVAEKASGDGLKDAMDVVVYDAERGASGKMENLSPGEIDMVRAAFALGLSEHHSSVLGIRWLTAWADEPGSALTTDNAHRWMRMQRVALERLGIRQLLLVTHDEAVKATCDRVLDISELQVDAPRAYPQDGRTAVDNEASPPATGAQGLL